MVRFSSTLTLVVLAIMVAVPGGCSQAQFRGDLDDETLPDYFSGAFGAANLNGRSLVLGVWTSLPDTCGLASEFLAGVNKDINDEEAPIDFMAEFATDRVPTDWWLHAVVAESEDRDDVDGAELGDSDVRIDGIMCHFSDFVDVREDSFASKCAKISEPGDLKVAEFVDDERFVIEGDIDLLRFRTDGGTEDKVGEFKGRAEATHCSGFSDSLGDFFDACFRDFSDQDPGCSTAGQRMFDVVNYAE
jgi:hypothetical protein